MKIEENSIVYPLPTIKLLKHRESYWHVILPEGYKEFISKYNGAAPIQKVFSVGEHEYEVDRFLCILGNYNENDPAEYNISNVITGLDGILFFDKEAEYYQLIPIVKTPYANYICLNYRYARENPTVVFLDAHSSWNLEPSCDDLFPNFDTFLASFDVEE